MAAMLLRSCPEWSHLRGSPRVSAFSSFLPGLLHVMGRCPSLAAPDLPALMTTQPHGTELTHRLCPSAYPVHQLPSALAHYRFHQGEVPGCWCLSAHPTKKVRVMLALKPRDLRAAKELAREKPGFRPSKPETMQGWRAFC